MQKAKQALPQQPARRDAPAKAARTTPSAGLRTASAQLRATAALIDASPRMAAQRQIGAMIDTSPRMHAYRAQTAQLQSAPVANATGLPDNLKGGIEALSGMSMDHVKVHYNAAQPAQLNALAYAQGRDIYVAPGQEKHLPHEAWHVVQQAQGRVRPTRQMKAGVAVNDDAGLEAEADLMGAKALQMGPSAWRELAPPGSASPAVQRVVASKLLPKTAVKETKSGRKGHILDENPLLGTYRVKFDDDDDNAGAYHTYAELDLIEADASSEEEVDDDSFEILATKSDGALTIALTACKPMNRDLLAGAASVAERITHSYPPDRFVYIGVGQSPVLIVAYLAAQGCSVYTVPLSSFKYGATDGMSRAPAMGVDEEANLHSHFDAFLPSPKSLDGKHIVVIDFVMHGRGAIAAYNYIHRYYLGRKIVRPEGDQFWDDSDLVSVWDYEPVRLQSLELKLAILCARENAGPIADVAEYNLHSDSEEVDEDIGVVSRLHGPEDYTIYAAENSVEDELMGKLDAEALKRFSPYGKQADKIAKDKPRASYTQLVALFKAYLQQKAHMSTARKGERKDGESKRGGPPSSSVLATLNHQLHIDEMERLAEVVERESKSAPEKKRGASPALAHGGRPVRHGLARAAQELGAAITRADKPLTNDIIMAAVDLSEAMHAIYQRLSTIARALAVANTTEALAAIHASHYSILTKAVRTIPKTLASRALVDTVVHKLAQLAA